MWPTGFALPALLVLLTFLCATGFYIADRQTTAALLVLPAELDKQNGFQSNSVVSESDTSESNTSESAESELPAKLSLDTPVDAEDTDKSNTYLSKPVVLTLNSRIIESFATTRHPALLTLFPERDQFQSMFPDSSRLKAFFDTCLLYTSPSPRDATLSRMPSSA